MDFYFDRLVLRGTCPLRQDKKRIRKKKIIGLSRIFESAFPFLVSNVGKKTCYFCILVFSTKL